MIKEFIEKYKITVGLGIGGAVIIGSTVGSCEFTPGETVENAEPVAETAPIKEPEAAPVETPEAPEAD